MIFQGTVFYINTTGNILPVDCLDLPLPIDEFIDGVIWKLRVNSYNEEDGELYTEIIDYNYPLSDVTEIKQKSFYFYGIERIRFRSLDTSGFLKSVILKQLPIAENKIPVSNIKKETPAEHIVLKTMRVPFWKINFLYGTVSFPLFIDALNQEIVFEIANADIRPEFAAIRDYFAKALKKKLIPVNITIRYTDDRILSSTAKSEDIDSINNHMIDSMRFEFVKRGILKAKRLPIDGRLIHTMDDLLSSFKEGKILFSSEMNLIDGILDIKKSKHYLQLKYLSSKHEASVLKVRFVLQPFSFLLLLAGGSKYHIIWETLDSEEATYIWHTDKTRESLRITLSEIETILNEIKLNGRQNFLEKETNNFSRIVHDYKDTKKGFVSWKGALEGKLV